MGSLSQRLPRIAVPRAFKLHCPLLDNQPQRPCACFVSSCRPTPHFATAANDYLTRCHKCCALSERSRKLLRPTKSRPNAMPRAGDAAAHAHRVYAQLKRRIGRAASAQAVPGADDSTDGSDGPFSGSVCPGGEMFAALVKAPARVLGSDCAGLSSREQHWRRQPLGRMGNRASRRGELWGIVWRGVAWLNVNRVAYGMALA